jgi:phosphatidylglycerol:prolipoprotein diacylglycerol transferase
MLPQVFHLHLPFKLPLIGSEFILYSYGLMMVIAFLATQWLAARLARSRGIDPEIFVNATLLALIAGVVGSRMSHIFENLSDYTRPELSAWENFINMVNIRSGGLTFYGGLILATPVVAGYTMLRKVPLRVAMDIAAPCIVLGLAIGRVGCFLNGCCYGAGTTLPWAVRFPYDSSAYVEQFYGSNGERLDHDVPRELLAATPRGVRLLKREDFKNDPALVALAAKEKSNPVHPAQLYSTFNALLITAILLCYFTIPHTAGRVFALMLILEGPTRFLLEMLRVEPPVLGQMSLSMVIGLVLFVIGILLWFGLGAARDRQQFPTAQPA